MRMKWKEASRWLVIAPLIVVLLGVPVNARGAPGDGIAVPITGTVGSTGTFTGSFTIASFQVVSGQLFAVGTLTGTLTDNGTQIGTVNTLFTLNVSIAEATCGTLTITLGSIDLNLLGFQLRSGAFNFVIAPLPDSSPTLLNMLCAIARQLASSGQAPVQHLVGLLNQVVAAY